MTHDRQSKKWLARTGPISAVALSALMFCGNANAQMAVIDPAHIAAQFGEFGQQAVRWGEQGQQWMKEYQQWKQQYDAMFSRMQSFRSGVSMQEGAPMQEVDNEFNVTERCGEQSGGGGASGMIGRITGVQLEGNINVQRWNNCRAVQVARNTQYNETVRYLRDQAKAMSDEAKQLDTAMADKRMDQTELLASTQRISTARAENAEKKSDYDRRMQAWDVYVNRAEENQVTLTRTAMRGRAGLIQQVTTTAVLRATLCGGGKCERRSGPPVGRGD